jgi:hypothetical protein
MTENRRPTVAELQSFPSTTLMDRLRAHVELLRARSASELEIGTESRVWEIAANSLEDILDAAPGEGPVPAPTGGMTVRLVDPKTGDLMTEGEVASIEDAKHQLLALTDHWLYMSRFTPEIDVVQQAFWLGTLFWKITDATGNVLEQGTIADIPREDHEYSAEELDRR